MASRVGDGGNTTLDKKKPFSRPFSKDRIEPSFNAVRMASGSPIPQEPSALLRQNQELRQRILEEANSYRRRLDTYKQATQNQSALVSRLQAKVMQYKQRCSELENQMSDNVAICPQFTDAPKAFNATTTQLPSISSKALYSASAAPASLPVVPSNSEAQHMNLSIYNSDESDGSFERKRIEDEKNL